MTGIEAGKTWSRIGAEVAPTSSAASGVWGSLNEVSGYVGAGTWPAPFLGAGYFGSGLDSSNLRLTVINKFAFPDDTRSTLGTGLTVGRAYLAAMANSGTAGYFGGGSEGAPSYGALSSIEKVAFPADTISTLGAGLLSANQYLNGMANSGTAGYFGGGVISAGYVSTVQKVAFPGDTISTLGVGLSQARGIMGSMANSGTAGYFGGGASGPYWAMIDKFAFPGDTRTTLSSGLSVSTQQLAGMSDNGVAGYFCGGYSSTVPANTATVQKCAFPSDTISTLGTGLSAATRTLGGMAESGTAGYVGGGNTSSVTATVDKFAFPGETRTTLGTGLSVAAYALAGMADTQ